MTDMAKEIRRAVDTGKAVLGFKETEKNILKGNGQLLILSGNIQKKEKERLESLAKTAKLPAHSFQGTSMERGAVCGKPFTITSLLVLEQGKSTVVTSATKSK